MSQGVQDEVSQVIANCTKSPEDIKKKIYAATSTKASLEKLNIAATAINNQARTSRDIQNIGSWAIVCSV